MPQIVRSRSPVASGMRIVCLSRLKTSMLPGTAGSSMNSTSYGSIAAANWISIGGGTAQWASNITAPSGPTRLRVSLIASTSRSMSLGLPEKRMRPAGAGLVGLGRGIHADFVADVAAQQVIDRHAPELAGDVPQGHVDGRDRVGHVRAAALVAVRAVHPLPEVLDPRGILAIEQFEQRIGQRAGDGRVEPVTSPQPMMPWLVSILK